MAAKLKKILKIIFPLLVVFGIIWISGIEIFLCEIPIMNGMVVLLFDGFFGILTIYFLVLALGIKKKLLKYFSVILTTILMLFVHVYIWSDIGTYQIKPPYTVLEVSNFDKEIVVTERNIPIFTNGRLYIKIAPGIWKCEGSFLESGLCPISSGNYTAWYDDVEKCLCIKAVFWNGKEEEVYRFYSVN